VFFFDIWFLIAPLVSLNSSYLYLREIDLSFYKLHYLCKIRSEISDLFPMDHSISLMGGSNKNILFVNVRFKKMTLC